MKCSAMWKFVERQHCLPNKSVTFPEKVKTWNNKGHCTSFSSSFLFSKAAVPPPLFCFQKQHPPYPHKKIILESSCSKISENSIGKQRWIRVLDAGHRPSYLQNLNCAECPWNCPWNFEGVISRNIFDWLL